MSRHIQIVGFTSALLAAALVWADSASAQLVALRHHSTIAGDTFSGASELVRAQGTFLRDEAAAAESWIRVAAAADQLQYQRTEYAYQVKNMRLDYLQKKADVNRQRQQMDTASEQAAALQLLTSTQRGVPQWPKALKSPKFASSMTMIESLLRNWSPDDTTGDAYRRALATEAGVLRERVASDASIDHGSRVQAVQTLQQLLVLVQMPAADLNGATQQLASLR